MRAWRWTQLRGLRWSQLRGQRWGQWLGGLGAGAGAGRAVRAVRVVVAGLVFVLPMTVTLELKHMGERGVLTEQELQQVAT